MKVWEKGGIFDHLRADRFEMILEEDSGFYIYYRGNRSRKVIQRYHNEGGLYNLGNVERANQVIMGRRLLPNEVQIDVAGKSRAEGLEEAICIIDGFCPEMGYEYELDDERNYSSWVRSRGLR